MTNPVTPSPELVQQWFTEWDNTQNDDCYKDYESHIFVAARAAQWGADMELEACCEWLHWQNLATHPELIPSLRAVRRPKPLSLKERLSKAITDGDEKEALKLLEELDDSL